MNTPGFWFAVAFLLFASTVTIVNHYDDRAHKGKYRVTVQHGYTYWTTTIKPLCGGCVQIDTGEIICGSFTIRKQN